MWHWARDGLVEWTRRGLHPRSPPTLRISRAAVTRLSKRLIKSSGTDGSSRISSADGLDFCQVKQREQHGGVLTYKTNRLRSGHTGSPRSKRRNCCHKAIRYWRQHHGGLVSCAALRHPGSSKERSLTVERIDRCTQE